VLIVTSDFHTREHSASSATKSTERLFRWPQLTTIRSFGTRWWNHRQCQNLRGRMVATVVVDCSGPMALSKVPAGEGNREVRADKVFHRKPPLIAQKTLTGNKREGYDFEQATKMAINGAWEWLGAFFARQ
jgi:hypothetical protein